MEKWLMEGRQKLGVFIQYYVKSLLEKSKISVSNASLNGGPSTKNNLCPKK